MRKRFLNRILKHKNNDEEDLVDTRGHDTFRAPDADRVLHKNNLYVAQPCTSQCDHVCRREYCAVGLLMAWVLGYFQFRWYYVLGCFGMVKRQCAADHSTSVVLRCDQQLHWPAFETRARIL